MGRPLTGMLEDEQQNSGGAEAALASICVSEPSAWLEAQPHLVQNAKDVSEYFFARSKQYAPKVPLPRLLTNGFDAEQIWQQIDLLDRPLLSVIRRRLRELEKCSFDGAFMQVGKKRKEIQLKEHTTSSVTEDDFLMEEAKDLLTEDEGDRTREGDNNDKNHGNGVEDAFLNLEDMEKFVGQAEAEAGQAPEEDIEENLESDDEVGEAFQFSAALVGKDEGEAVADAIRYEDFFGKAKRPPLEKLKFNHKEGGGEEESGDEENDDEDNNGTDRQVDESDEAELEQEHLSDQKMNMSQGDKQSTYEKELEKTRKRIEELERANLEDKDWTMQGEITAGKRAKNSALEVELDFEHNARPPPVITEEVTASLESIIRGRIAEGLFDDVKRTEPKSAKLPKEHVEIDENKSAKGLGEIYEAEYMQATGLATAPVSAMDSLKKEATALFRGLCTKLDALSHYHFAPKPIIEDMAVRDNVPALAMEEVAPLLVSDASMLAPEELFAGQGAIKDKKELDRKERKQLRAKRKRVYKGEQKKRELKRPRVDDSPGEENDAPRAGRKQKLEKSSYGKSSKIFAELENKKQENKKQSAMENDNRLQPSFLKL